VCRVSEVGALYLTNILCFVPVMAMLYVTHELAEVEYAPLVSSPLYIHTCVFECLCVIWYTCAPL
jgi:hypothetical protein